LSVKLIDWPDIPVDWGQLQFTFPPPDAVLKSITSVAVLMEKELWPMIQGYPPML